MKKKKEIKVNEEEKSLKAEKKENRFAKICTVFRRKWLVSGLNTLIIIAVLIAVFIGTNVIVKKIDPTPIDCTSKKEYTLTSESKERISKIDKDVTIYFMGENCTDASKDEGLYKEYLLAKQYNKANSKIKVEVIDIEKNLEIAKKFEITQTDNSGEYYIVIECGEVSRKLGYYSEMLTYDSNYRTISVGEQKITSAILNVTSGYIPTVYFLSGYSQFSLGNTGNLNILQKYLDDEVLTYKELSILKEKEIPEDCSTLVITTPEKDFDDAVTGAILNYINKGGNILWLNGSYVTDLNLTNVNKILSQYGVNGFGKGYVFETDKNNILLYFDCFATETQNSEVTKGIAEGNGVVFLSPTKISINEEELENKKVIKTDLLKSSPTTYFTTNMTGTATKDDSTEGPFLLGAQLEKTISEANEEEKDEVKSTLVIYSNDAFISDFDISQGQGLYMAQLPGYNNMDLVLNSVAYLNNRDVDITIRKSYSDSETRFTPTEGEKLAIIILVFLVPIAIIIFGLMVWSKRRNIKGAFYTFIVIFALLVIATIWELLAYFIDKTV